VVQGAQLFARIRGEIRCTEGGQLAAFRSRNEKRPVPLRGTGRFF
jgi:hypothetical protein